MHLSVIICTHNPRPDYLRRTLDALRVQTLPKEQWELLLIDNASKEPLAKSWDLSWHPQARHIREEELGLTPARLRGIKESTGELLVFVDDDNVLDSDYLERTLEIACTHPFVAIWCGSLRGEFEIQPSALVRPYLQFLAVREAIRDVWANSRSAFEAEPFGAGMCVRRGLACHYLKEVERNPRRVSLGRRGNALTSGEDTDMAWMACDMGLGMGRFAALKLTHLIPAGRVSEEYMLRLIEGMHASTYRLRHLYGGQLQFPNLTLRCRVGYFLDLIFRNGFERRARLARWRAEKCVRQALKDGSL